MSDGWGVFEYHDSVHVVPMSEINEHYFLECQCCPKYENGVYVHNSFNGLVDLDLTGIVDCPYGNC